MKNEHIILGIDPGTNIMGLGLIICKGKEINLIMTDVLKLNKILDHHLKLKRIFETIIHMIKEHKPDEIAIESPFFGKNVQSMLKLGRAQGVAIAAALSMNTPVFEYSPKKIKQSITGKGSASKEQVAKMLTHILNLKKTPQYFDESDAIAVAVCHQFQNPTLKKTDYYSSWENYLAKNPNKIIK